MGQGLSRTGAERDGSWEHFFIFFAFRCPSSWDTGEHCSGHPQLLETFTERPSSTRQLWPYGDHRSWLTCCSQPSPPQSPGCSRTTQPPREDRCSASMRSQTSVLSPSAPGGRHCHGRHPPAPAWLGVAGGCSLSSAAAPSSCPRTWSVARASPRQNTHFSNIFLTTTVGGSVFSLFTIKILY